MKRKTFSSEEILFNSAPSACIWRDVSGGIGPVKLCFFLAESVSRSSNVRMLGHSVRIAVKFALSSRWMSVARLLAQNWWSKKFRGSSMYRMRAGLAPDPSQKARRSSGFVIQRACFVERALVDEDLGVQVLWVLDRGSIPLRILVAGDSYVAWTD
ncbi:hypothetical protein PG994_002725 [Apiospora phragmitis]|uniref:Uncharacterized protein n=1 Tax=Apiospora phragmitis TaxID=2905665 RepID=A0ABR1W9S7_9PEZI